MRHWNGVQPMMTNSISWAFAALALATAGCSRGTEPVTNESASMPTSAAQTGRQSAPPENSTPDELPPISTPAPIQAESALPITRSEPVAPIDPQRQADFDKLLSGNLDAQEWERIQQSLVDAGEDAAPLLAKELESTDVSRREQSSSILVLLGSNAKAAVPALVKAVNDSSAFVRANAAAALAQFPDHLDLAKQSLVKLLDADEPELRRLAATNLSLLGAQAEDLLPRLTLALDDKDTEVVRPIAQLLGEIGPPAKPALEKLQKIAFEQEGAVKAAAELAVQQIEGQTEPFKP